ncbi:MAG: DUF3179 domain-containing protein [Candidatus Cyclobacteriaceae bacterium M3_2C_046]
MKGFDLSNASIPLRHIKDGGPPRDGIPSIDQPDFLPASKAGLEPDTRILGVKTNGIAKAYPIPILNYHEIVNDLFGSRPVVITYCPLCGSGVAFDGQIEEKRRTFGVSGLLYNSDVLLYDRQSESLWSQIKLEAISGPMRGKELTMLPTSNTTWQEWKKQHPNTLVLSENTGYRRNYDRNPYPGYAESENLYFEVEKSDKRYHPKETVIGIKLNGQFKAYPFSELDATGLTEIKDHFQDQTLLIQYHQESSSATILNSQREEIPSLTTFWFAWYAFHPDTKVFSVK